jgi:hypothetical protein
MPRCEYNGSLECFEGELFGKVVRMMKRKRQR